jgi:hypothetical protein
VNQTAGPTRFVKRLAARQVRVLDRRQRLPLHPPAGRGAAPVFTWYSTGGEVLSINVESTSCGVRGRRREGRDRWG